MTPGGGIERCQNPLCGHGRGSHNIGGGCMASGCRCFMFYGDRTIGTLDDGPQSSTAILDAETQAVLDAAEKVADTWYGTGSEMMQQFQSAGESLVDRVAALRASRVPVSPPTRRWTVETELREAILGDQYVITAAASGDGAITTCLELLRGPRWVVTSVTETPDVA